MPLNCMQMKDKVEKNWRKYDGELVNPIREKNGHIVYPIHLPGKEGWGGLFRYDPDEMYHSVMDNNNHFAGNIESLEWALKSRDKIILIGILFNVFFFITGPGILLADLLLYLVYRRATKTVFRWCLTGIMLTVKWWKLSPDDKLKFISYLEHLERYEKQTLLQPTKDQFIDLD